MALASPPTPAAHHRKRHAGHHRRTKRYHRPYLPYLPMLLIVGLGLLLNTAWNRGIVLGTATDMSSNTLLSETNTERIRNGDSALALNPQLNAAAQAKAEDMVRSDYWSHISPDGKTPWSFITASGYRYDKAGENLAYGFTTPQEAVRGWMNSPEHRANILNDDYQEVGFGIASAPDYQGKGRQTIIVAEYAQPKLPAAATAHPDIPGVLGDQTEVASRPVSRIQTLAGDQYAWSLVAIIVLSGLAMVMFILRHAYVVHRWATRTEMYVVQHPYIDIAIVALITLGVILTRTSGIIR